MGELDIISGKNENVSYDFLEYLQSINDTLVPGMPVLLTKKLERPKEQRTGFGFSNKRDSEKTLLFFSDGNLSNAGAFSLQEGKHNNSYLMFNDDLTSYQIVNNKGRPLLSESVLNNSNDGSWKKELMDVGSYSATKWTASSASREEEIHVGDILFYNELLLMAPYSEAINALRFAGDAVYFQLDSFYFDSLSRVNRIDESKTKIYEAQELACLNAVMGLLDGAKREQHVCGNESVQATQLGLYSGGSQSFIDNGHPVCDTDYLIHRGDKKFAFVKIGKGLNVSEIYILPVKNMDTLVELAFSDEIVKKNYPVGFIERFT